jgi:hypothetical protein
MNPVTDTVAPARPGERRNAVLLADLAAQIEAEVNNPRRELLKGIFGKKADQDLATSTAARFLRRSAYQCDVCKHKFDAGDVVFRRWRSHPEADAFEPRRHLGVYCEECVRTHMHPSWWEKGAEPVPCAGGCGVLVTHPYWALTITTCSTRCAEAVAAARRSAHRTPRECADCGQTFQPRRVDARYCSDACRQKAYRERQSHTDGPQGGTP